MKTFQDIRVLIAKCKMLNINLSPGCIFAYVGRIFQMAVVFSDISCKNPFMQGFNLPQSSITLSLAFSMMKSFQSKCHTLCLLLNKYYLFWLMYILVGYISIVFFLLRSFSLKHQGSTSLFRVRSVIFFELTPGTYNITFMM